MQAYPVRASEWVRFTPNNRDALRVVGAVEVNDKLMTLWTEYSKIWLLYGGRGGGKSDGVFDRLINNCINDKYFNCCYGRKVYEKVKKSCFETIIFCIKKQQKEHLFHFSEADNSSLIITCKHNGNKFQPFGADKPENMKSIKDPTHIVCEEFDQFTLNDFQEILPSLRTQRAKCEFFGMFNTRNVLPSHWINYVFFPEQYAGDLKSSFDAMQGRTVKKIFVNFPDNYFINQEEYEADLRLASGGNEILFQQLAHGAWGIVENGNPWLHAFDQEKHIKPIPFLQSYPIFLTFDINADPLSCTAWQMSPLKGGTGSFLHAINEFGGHIKAEDICQRIRSTYPNSIFYVTGDRSGQNEDVGRNQTIYQMIAGYLGLNDKQLNLNTHNLEHADSRLLSNAMFAHYPNLFIDPKCKNLILDCQKATVDMDSVRPSILKKDRESYKMDYFDGMRYLFQTYFNNFVKDTYLKVLYKNKKAA